jgi:hypothetical protein
MSDLDLSAPLLSPGTLELEGTPAPGEVITVAVGRRGPAGPPGPSGVAAVSYTHTQVAPALVWTVQHNLGYYPAGFSIQADGIPATSEMEAIVTQVSTSVALLTFLDPTTGKVFVS